MRTKTPIEHSLAEKILIDGEDDVAFRDLVIDLYKEFQPATPFEASLIDRMVVARWRQERVWELERTCMNIAKHPAALNRILRYEAQYDRQYLRAHQRFVECSTTRLGSAPPPAQAASNVVPIDRAA